MAGEAAATNGGTVETAAPAAAAPPPAGAAAPTTAAAPPPAGAAAATAAPAATSTGSTAAADAAATAKKRPPPNTAEGSADAKRLRADFAVGDRGVFYTTMSPGTAHAARRDLVRLLEDAMPEEEGNHSNPSIASVPGGAGGAKLDAELRRLRNTSSRFTTCGIEVAKGTGFVKFVGGASGHKPSEVVVRLLQAQRAEYLAQKLTLSSRLICRVLPIDHTCKPHLEDFKKLAEAVLQPHLDSSAEPTVWALEFRARNTATLKKEAVLDVIDSLVCKERHKVNLNDPQKCILVEVNPLFCGLSVLLRWGELKKYNLHALSSPEESNQKKAAAPKSSSAAAPTRAAARSGASVASSAAAGSQNGTAPPAPSPESASAAPAGNSPGGNSSADAAGVAAVPDGKKAAASEKAPDAAAESPAPPQGESGEAARANESAAMTT